MTFPRIYLSGILLFLAGCASPTILEHQSFSMGVPSWDQQSLLTSQGIPYGFTASDADCIFNLTFTLDSYLQTAQPLFQELHSLGPNVIMDYQLLDNLAFIEYVLPNNLGGSLKILSCPSGFTYTVDYQCLMSALPERRSEILSILNSMAC
ncbi:MAG TPA: hypothetical protein VJH37_01600 [Candidatus Nanoarchaeia archaeon]|nr:hypothetical protein [Candidatus Nanoarchaeia archaeon]